MNHGYDKETHRRFADMDDYEVEDGEPDPRGWKVKAADGSEIGEVDDMIVDTRQMKVRYLDVEVDEDKLGLEHADRHLLVPVDQARLDEDDECVNVDRLDAAGLGSLRGEVDMATITTVVDRKGEAPVVRREIILRRR